MNEKTPRVKEGRWRWSLGSGKAKEDGSVCLIRRFSIAPAEWYEWGLDSSGKPYEQYAWCESDLYEDSSYCHAISEAALQEEVLRAIALFEKAGKAEEAEHFRRITEQLLP